VPAGKRFTFIHNDSNLARQYTISRAGADTFLLGGTSTTIATQGEVAVLQSDGTSVWTVVSRTYPTSISATFTPSAAFGSVTTTGWKCTRIGNQLQVYGKFTTATLAASTASLAMPTGLTIDTGALTGSTCGEYLGYFHQPGSITGTMFSNSNEVDAAVFYDGSTNSSVYITSQGAANNFVKQNGSGNFVASQVTVCNFMVPISGWSY
jgi:hypothetical protein